MKTRLNGIRVIKLKCPFCDTEVETAARHAWCYNCGAFAKLDFFARQTTWHQPRKATTNDNSGSG